MHAGDFYSAIVALLFAIAAGLIGSFALMKRMLLAGDVISHLALPGLGLALMLHFNPIVGGACTLFAGTLLVAQLQKKTGMATDAMIGVAFATSLAIGAALTPEEDLVDALFGKFQQLSIWTFFIGLLAVLLIIVFVFRFREELVLSLFSPELAAATGVKLNRLNLFFLLTFSLTVLVGLRFMGALLAGALIMLPAAIGRRLSASLSGFLWTSCASSVIAVALGFLLTTLVFPTLSLGPAMTLVSAGLFGISLLRRPQPGL